MKIERERGKKKRKKLGKKRKNYNILGVGSKRGVLGWDLIDKEWPFGAI